MKKHDDHVRVLEALIYNQETLINLKDAKIEELEDGKQQLQFHVTKLQDNQLFYDVRDKETWPTWLRDVSIYLLHRHFSSWRCCMQTYDFSNPGLSNLASKQLIAGHFSAFSVDGLMLNICSEKCDNGRYKTVSLTVSTVHTYFN